MQINGYVSLHQNGPSNFTSDRSSKRPVATSLGLVFQNSQNSGNCNRTDHQRAWTATAVRSFFGPVQFSLQSFCGPRTGLLNTSPSMQNQTTVALSNGKGEYSIIYSDPYSHLCPPFHRLGSFSGIVAGIHKCLDFLHNICSRELPLCLCGLQGCVLCITSYDLGVLLVDCVLQVVDLILQGIECLLSLCCRVHHYKAAWGLEGFLGREEQWGSREGLGLSRMMSRAWPW